MKTKVKPQFFYDEGGNKVGVKLKSREFELLMEGLEDAHDVYMVHKRTLKKGKTVPFETIKKKLFGDAKK